MNSRRCLFSFVLFTFFVSILSCGDGSSDSNEPLTLSQGAISYDFHKANLGDIIFRSSWKSLKEMTNFDRQTEVVLNEGSEFYLALLPQYSQLYYLSLLAPNLSANELCQRGNWNVQFSVDDEMVYEDNINPGAGGCSYRNDYAAVGVPLVSNDQGDAKHWGSYLWKRFFYKENNERRFADGPHKLTIAFRPYLEVDGALKYGDVVAQGSVNLSLKETPVDPALLRVQRIAPHEDWTIAPQDFDTTKLRTIHKKIAQKRYKQVTGIAVLRRGELLVESYFNGANRKTLHDTRSVGKSFVGTFLGMAIADGYIKSEASPLSTFYSLKQYDNYHAHKEQISLKDLLMMNAPFQGNDSDPNSPGNEENMYPTNDWVKFTLDLPIDTSKLKQGRWEYCTAASVLLGDIVNQRVPKSLEAYAAQKLFEPLRIQDYRWQYTPTGVVNTAGSLQLTLLDYAKYGLLYQQKGKWQGQQIVPEKWVEQSTSPMIQRGDQAKEGYGYQLWWDEIKVGTETYAISYASGNGGNKIMIFKDIPIVIVITATAYGDILGHQQAKEMVAEYLLPMVLPTL